MTPHSFVLADLFDVDSLSLPPDQLLEDEPGLAWTTCPACEGAGWVVSAQPNTWTGGDAYCPCLRCRQRGEVLELEPAEVAAPLPLALAA